MNTINLCGKDYPVQFGTGLMLQLGLKYKLNKVSEADKLIQAIQWDDLDWIIQRGIANAANILEIESESPEKITALVDQELSALPQVMQILTIQLTLKKIDGEDEEEGEKKAKERPAFKK